MSQRRFAIGCAVLLAIGLSVTGVAKEPVRPESPDRSAPTEPVAFALDEALRLAAEDPEAAASLLATVVGNANAAYGRQQWDSAIEAYGQALILADALGTDETETIEWLKRLQRAHRERGQFADAEDVTRRLLALQESTLGADHTDLSWTLTRLAAIVADRRPDDAEAEALHLRALAIAEQGHGERSSEAGYYQQQLGYYYRETGEHAQAAERYERAVSIRDEHKGDADPTLADLMVRLASEYEALGRPDAAEAAFRRALSVHERHKGPDHPDLAGVLWRLGSLLLRQDRPEEALPIVERAQALSEVAWGDSRHAALLVAVYSALGRDEQARAVRRQIAADAAPVAPLEPADLQARSLTHDGFERASAGEFAEAESLMRQALAIHEQHSGTDSRAYAQALENLAVVFARQSLNEQAEDWYLEAIDAMERAVGSDHPWLAHKLGAVAHFYTRTRNHEPAAEMRRRALVIWDAQDVAGPDLARALEMLGAANDALGRSDEAAEQFARSARIWSDLAGEATPEAFRNRHRLAREHLQAGRQGEAELLLLELVTLAEESETADEFRVVLVMRDLGSLYASQERTYDAEMTYLEALEREERCLEPDSRELAHALLFYAQQLTRMELEESAAPLSLRAQQILDGLDSDAE